MAQSQSPSVGNRPITGSDAPATPPLPAGPVSHGHAVGATSGAGDVTGATGGTGGTGATGPTPLQQAAAKVEDAVEKEKSDLWKQEMNKEIGYVDPSKAPPEEEAPLMGATGVPEDATGATGPAPPIEPAPPEKPDPGPAESLSDGDKLWIRREIEAAMQGMSPQSRAELNT